MMGKGSIFVTICFYENVIVNLLEKASINWQSSA